jgi:diguanylate cyclase (GGDEF)-like protein
LPRRSRIIATIAGLIWLAHVGVVVLFRGAAPGQVLSDLIQLTLGAMVIYAIDQASRRSEGMAISFWRLAGVAYMLLLVAQALSVYNDLFRTSVVSWTNNMLFSFWFVPLAMAIFLDPEHEAGKIDTVVSLDFVQGVLVCIAAYLYFFYIPKSASGELKHEMWAPYFVGYSFVAGAFILRAAITRSRDVRVLFGRMGVFLALSGCVDALFYYGPGAGLNTGAWFDLLWSAVLVVPMIIALMWRQTEAPELKLEAPQREKRIYTEIFFLIYPLLVLFMSLRIARERLGLAALVVFSSFVCSSARLLVTQHRLLGVREALRREASRDGLTSLWNRKSILSVLERELLRAERDRQNVGVIMIDVDHFKHINDTRGHAAGDAVLRIIASGIAAMVRTYDSVGRIGGEEFLIVAPNCDLGQTWELAERVRQHIASCSIISGGDTVRVSLSLGVATAKIAGDLEKLLHNADTALYLAKNTGRNRVEPSLGRAATASVGASPTPKRDFWI